MLLNIIYNDIEYGEEESTIIEINDNANIKEVVADFQKFSSLYLDGYELGEYETEEDLQENYPDLTLEDAKKFYELRNEGLSVDLIVTAFLDEFPEYCKENEQKQYTITFSDYGDLTVC